MKRATARLANKRFTRFTESGMSSYDERLHLCRNKRFVYDTVSSSEFGPTITNRTVGTWRVVSARIRRRVWSARVRGRPDEGGSITIRIRTDGDRTTVDGNTVFVDRSDLC